MDNNYKLEQYQQSLYYSTDYERSNDQPSDTSIFCLNQSIGTPINYYEIFCLTQQQQELDSQINNSNTCELIVTQNCENDKEENGFSSLSKQKTISKLKKTRQKKLTVKVIYNKIITEETLGISHGLYVSKDGIIRYCYTLGQVSFGFSYHQYHNINYSKSSQIIEMDLSNVSDLPLISLERAMQFISHTSCDQFFEASEALKKFYYDKKELKKVLSSIKMNSTMIKQQESELIKYIKSCKEYIQQYSKENEGKIFQFGIGRINFQLQDEEFLKTGYSKSFLDLIGIDVDNFCAMILRHQKIDLIQKKEEIMEQSLIGINLKVQKIVEHKYTCNITTFDGFPLKLYLAKKLGSPKYQYKKVSQLDFEHILIITEVDIDLQDLQNLITYRQKLLSNKDLDFDDFIRRELSYKFEDVEYSVHSQSFIEKYYHENLLSLYELEQQKQQQLQNVNKQCGYRAIQTQNLTYIIEYI